MSISDRMPWDTVSEAEAQAIATALDRSAYSPLATDLGRFIVLWAQLEQAITILLSRVTISADAVEIAALGGQLDLYAKCRALRALAKRHKLPESWHKTLKKISDYISGQLRERRNRLVHDTWLIEDGKFTRFEYRPRALDGDVPLSAVDETPVTMSELREACARVYLARSLVKRLVDEFDASKSGGRQQ